MLVNAKLFLLLSRVDADDAELASTNHAVSHPLGLVHKLEVVFTRTTDAFLVHVSHPFDVFLFVEIQQGKQDLDGHEVLTPLGRLAHHVVNGDLLAVLELVLDGQRDLLLYAVDTGLMSASEGEDDAALLFNATN